MGNRPTVPFPSYPLRPRKRRSAIKMQIRRSVPKADKCAAANTWLFDHLVGSQEDSRWQGNAQVFRRLLIDHKLKLRWQFGWDFSGFGAAQQLGNERPPLPMGAHWINAIGHESAGSSKLWKQRDRWHPKSKGQSRDTLRIAAEDRRRQHEQGIHSFLARSEERRVGKEDSDRRW